jgi:hypothetical protein
MQDLVDALQVHTVLVLTKAWAYTWALIDHVLPRKEPKEPVDNIKGINNNTNYYSLWRFRTHERRNHGKYSNN